MRLKHWRFNLIVALGFAVLGGCAYFADRVAAQKQPFGWIADGPGTWRNRVNPLLHMYQFANDGAVCYIVFSGGNMVASDPTSISCTAVR
jgi:hypothetical protein